MRKKIVTNDDSYERKMLEESDKRLRAEIAKRNAKIAKEKKIKKTGK